MPVAGTFSTPAVCYSQLRYLHCHGSAAEQRNHAVLGMLFVFMVCQVDYYREIYTTASARDSLRSHSL